MEVSINHCSLIIIFTISCVAWGRASFLKLSESSFLLARSLQSVENIGAKCEAISASRSSRAAFWSAIAWAFLVW